MSVNISLFAGAGAQFFDNNGVPLTGGLLYTYSAGTTTPSATYTSITGSIANSNPIVLDSAGRVSNEIWLTGGNTYKFILQTSTGVQIGSWDNISGANDQTALASSIGSSLVGYNEGDTGAVTTTVQAKLRQTVSVIDFGADATGANDSTTAIQNAINALTTGQTLIFPAGTYKTNTGFTINNKTNVRLTGGGTINMNGAGTAAYIFQPTGTVAGLEIDHLILTGDNNSGYSQVAIGCNSGQVISNTSFHDLNISNINVGISHNCFSGGSWTKGVCYNNNLLNIIGTTAGSGYGIHIAGATNIRVYDNVIDGAQRHSIYQASGVNCNNVIHNNEIVNHRSTVFNGSFLAAIHVSRGSNVTISNNKIYNYGDGAILIDQDTPTSLSVSNILVIGNTFTNKLNATPSMLIGEQLIPTTATAPFNITVTGNTFTTDASVAGGDDIYILNGTEIFIQNNNFRRYNVTSSLGQCIELGGNAYISSNSHIGNIIVQNNTATSDASVASTQFAYICTQLSTGTSNYTIKNNSFIGWSNEFNFATTPPTNPNSKFKFRTSVSYQFTIASQSSASPVFTVYGVKTTSQVAVRPQYSLQAAPEPAYDAWANDNSVNGVTIQAVNATTSISTQPTQTFLIFVDDF